MRPFDSPGSGNVPTLSQNTFATAAETLEQAGDPGQPAGLVGYSLVLVLEPVEDVEAGGSRGSILFVATDALPTYPHIVSAPEVRCGKACIDGTRIAVVDIVAAVRSGSRPEDLTHHYSTRPLTLAEIHSALAYAYDHSAEIDAYFAREAEAERGLTTDPEAFLRSLRS